MIKVSRIEKKRTGIGTQRKDDRQKKTEKKIEWIQYIIGQAINKEG